MGSLVVAHFVTGAAEVVDAPYNCTASCQLANVRFDHCDLFSFFPFEGDLGWEKYNDSLFTLKDDSLSELYRPTQSMSYCTPGSVVPSPPIQSPLSSSLCAFLRCSTYSATTFSGTMYLSKDSLLASQQSQRSSGHLF